MYESQKSKVTEMIRDAMEKNEACRVSRWREMDISARQRQQWQFVNSQLKGSKNKGKIVLNKNGTEVEDREQIKEVMEGYLLG